MKHGFSVSQEQAGNLQAVGLFSAGKAALVPDGSWMINSYRDNTPFEFGFAPLAQGPEGRRSMFNGLADSIWTGSKHQDEAWKWVQYLGSAECQAIVGEAGVVFPARPEATKLAEEAHKAKGSMFPPLPCWRRRDDLPLPDLGFWRGDFLDLLDGCFKGHARPG